MSLRRPVGPAPFLLLALVLLAAPLAAQEVRVEGGDDSPAAALLREILARNNYLRIDRDTILPASFVAPGDLVVYDAEVRLEGTVTGAVAVVGGHFFLRPRARVGGNIAVVGGDVYTSALATTGEILYTDPRTRVVIAGDSGVARPGEADVGIVPPEPAKRFGWIAGIPTYDRVNGLTVTGGALVRLSDEREGPRIEGWVSYRGEQENHIGGGGRFVYPLGVENLHLTAEASRETRTNDEWLRGDLSNSISVALNEKDYRDYYDADRASLMLTRPVGKPLIAGESWLGPRFGILAERARSLEAHRVFSIYDSDDAGRSNPPVIEETIVSAIAGTTLTWQGRTSNFTGDTQVEVALPGASDLEFTQLVAEGTFTAFAFRTHELSVYARSLYAFGDGAPPQRHAILGGGGTLPTLDIGDFRGDRLAFVESSYAIPFPRLALPYLGFPSIELLHATGAAWEAGDDMPEWVQNVGGGLAFAFFRVRVLVDPSVRPLEPKVSFRVTFPFQS